MWSHYKFSVVCLLVVALVFANVHGFVVPTRPQGFRDLSVAATAEPESKQVLPKRVVTATKRIQELDVLLDDLDSKIARIDERMTLSDVDELVVLQKEKERLEKQQAKYLDEWDDLEELLESHS
jgi:hypothetical protein